MRVKRFQADTLAEAYARVREALGDDALIVSTRQAFAPGLAGFGRREFVEVVAGLPADVDAYMPDRALDDDVAVHDFVRSVAEAAATGHTLDVSLPAEVPAAPRRIETGRIEQVRAEARRAATALAAESDAFAPPFANPAAGSARAAGSAATGVPAPVARARRAPAAPAPVAPTASAHDETTLQQLAASLSEVRALVRRLALDRASDTLNDAPAAVLELRADLLDQGVPPDVLLPALQHITASLPTDAAEHSVRDAALERLAAQLPATIFVVGPAGAGKTTFAVRLALQLQRQGLRVTIAGTDVDRAGAPQQLQAYGTATNIPVRSCYTPGELQGLIAEHAADIVIVDTAGNSGLRRERMAELQAFLQAVPERAVLLTVPATMKHDDLTRIGAAFRGATPQGFVLTRCDEAASFGAAFAFAAATRVGIAFSTHDDTVSSAPRGADNSALAAAVIEHRWPTATDARVTAAPVATATAPKRNTATNAPAAAATPKRAPARTRAARAG